MGGKKSSVSTIATSGATRYTAASSATSRPTSSSAGVRCSRIGRSTCASGPGPSLAPQPAQVESVVRRTSSRVNKTGRWYSRQGERRTDRRVPDSCCKRDEQHRESEIRGDASATEDHQQEKDH